jgi:hypothetical protein
MTAADLLRNSTSFPKQEKEFWTQPISLCESAKLAAAGDQNRAMIISLGAQRKEKEGLKKRLDPERKRLRSGVS